MTVHPLVQHVCPAWKALHKEQAVKGLSLAKPGRRIRVELESMNLNYFFLSHLLEDNYI